LLHDQGEADLALPFGGEEYVAKVRREQLLGAAAGFYRAVTQLVAQSRESGQPLTVQVSDRLVACPGLTEALARLDDAEIVSLPPGQAARGVLMNLEAIDAGKGQVKLLKHLAWREAAAASAPADTPPPPRPAQNRSAGQPTHVVYRGIAYGVDSGGLFVGRAPLDGRRMIVIADQREGVSSSHCEIVVRDGELKLHDLSRHGTYVNEKKVSGEVTLHPADVIRIGSPGAELTIIMMEQARGATA
jgi:FHA domain